MERAEKIIIVWLLWVSGVCAQTIDVFVVEKPQTLRLLNRYEQSLGESEISKLYLFMPFEILRSRVIMSDGFTTAMKVRNGTDDYFILTDSPGKPINLESAGSFKVIYQVLKLNDTVLVRHPIDLLQGTEPGKTVTGVINQNEPAIRFFKAGNWTYVRTFKGTGWVRIEKDGYSFLHEPSSKKQPIDIESLLQPIIAESNTVLKKLFTVLNRQNATDKSIPQWRVQKVQKKIICTLSPSDWSHTFTESRNLLHREIANVLLGIPCKTRLTDSAIEITIY
ncbi:hypothetical protein K1X84_16885 [bacterium]|nr:hypothetical protein [bacterium]